MTSLLQDPQGLKSKEPRQDQETILARISGRTGRNLTETIFQCLPVQLPLSSLLWLLLLQDPSWLRCRQGNLGFISLSYKQPEFVENSWGRTESHKGYGSSLKPHVQQTELGTPCSVAHLPGIVHSHGGVLYTSTVQMKLRLKID